VRFPTPWPLVCSTSLPLERSAEADLAAGLGVTTLLLVAAGVAAGIVGVVGGLASVISYPALLAAGLPPVAANVTNTVAMTAVGAGTVVGSGPELRGQGGRVLRLSMLGAVGGAVGALLLLSADAGTFELVVPYLVALGGLLLLARDSIRRWAARGALDRAAGSSRAAVGRRVAWVAALGLAAVYAGYFGAGAGIIVLAVIAMRHVEPYAVTNAIKTLVTGAANVVAAAVFVLAGDVAWMRAVPLALGMFIGGALGPALVRRLPETALRRSVAVAALVLACALAS
jgi:uncharacterized membrane protein YfcA